MWDGDERAGFLLERGWEIEGSLWTSPNPQTAGCVFTLEAACEMEREIQAREARKKR